MSLSHLTFTVFFNNWVYYDIAGSSMTTIWPTHATLQLFLFKQHA